MWLVWCGVGVVVCVLFFACLTCMSVCVACVFALMNAGRFSALYVVEIKANRVS